MTKTRSLWVSILFVLALVAASIATFLVGVRPILGLDLQGGVSVTLSAPPATPRSVMDRTVENIRNRVDAFGVAEPQIFVSGTNIDVQIPGLARGTITEKRETQYCLVNQDDQNLGCFAKQSDGQAILDSIEVKQETTRVCLTDGDGNTLGACFTTKAAADAALKALTVAKQDTGQFCVVGQGGQPLTLADDPTKTLCYQTKQEATAAKDAVTAQPLLQYCLTDADGKTYGCYPTRDDADAALSALRLQRSDVQYCVVSSAGKDLGCYLTKEKAQARLQETGQDRLLQLIGTTARLEQREVLGTVVPGDPNYDTLAVTCATKEEQATDKCTFQALEKQNVVFLDRDGQTKYQLGPVLVPGDAIKKAAAVYNTGGSQSVGTGWQVDFQLTDPGSKIFGDVTTNLVNKQLAIVLDREVISAPVIQEPITGGRGQITGNFTEQRAKDLATVLNAGALPVNLVTQQVVTVSPTLGTESLREGLIAGLIGIVLLAFYLLFYYRLLGLVAWAGMTIWAILAIGLVSLAGVVFGYSLTLAGVAGLVISLGVTADSYIVFFERLKDEVRGGRSPRSAVQPAFKRAYRTIVAADFITALAAIILYLTAVSSVRGFALTLGVATLLDLFVVYFFKRPTVFLIARNERLVKLRGFGLESGVAADYAPAAEPRAVPVAGGSK